MHGSGIPAHTSAERISALQCSSAEGFQTLIWATGHLVGAHHRQRGLYQLDTMLADVRPKIRNREGALFRVFDAGLNARDEHATRHVAGECEVVARGQK